MLYPSSHAIETENSTLQVDDDRASSTDTNRAVLGGQTQTSAEAAQARSAEPAQVLHSPASVLCTSSHPAKDGTSTLSAGEEQASSADTDRVVMGIRPSSPAAQAKAQQGLSHPQAAIKRSSDRLTVATSNINTVQASTVTSTASPVSTTSPTRKIARRTILDHGQPLVSQAPSPISSACQVTIHGSDTNDSRPSTQVSQPTLEAIEAFNPWSANESVYQALAKLAFVEMPLDLHAPLFSFANVFAEGISSPHGADEETIDTAATKLIRALQKRVLHNARIVMEDSDEQKELRDLCAYSDRDEHVLTLLELLYRFDSVYRMLLLEVTGQGKVFQEFKKKPGVKEEEEEEEEGKEDNKPNTSRGKSVRKAIVVDVN